jgi:hypothetical protein
VRRQAHTLTRVLHLNASCSATTERFVGYSWDHLGHFGISDATHQLSGCNYQDVIRAGGSLSALVYPDSMPPGVMAHWAIKQHLSNPTVVRCCGTVVVRHPKRVKFLLLLQNA